MKKFPAEFEALLTKTGRKVLAGTHAELSGVLATGRSRFVGAEGLLDSRKSKALAKLLDEQLSELLMPMEQEIPRSATWGMKVAYKEKLPKTVRVQTAMLDEDESPALERAKELGLITMLRSQSFHAFAQALSGYPLRKQWGLQTLCYRPGDYSGPHNDHHPDEPLGAQGYTDLHLTLCNDGVEHQWIVYEKKSHLSEIQSIATVGGVTCYRLPFWHYTTPLVGSAKARRWVLLGTFLDHWDD
ncbi:MAG: hypothetical protein DI536_31410 [Archangium gephyra]|uniref:Fe2OG dioxygenase domain-containing protein n=1 Tax=Archangium gephyra TaxID=48 RepID=A0A2W5ST41_9BACT|nr:MAG: hypothetical protein DI536_31410 [Archangium gephyra]